MRTNGYLDETMDPVDESQLPSRLRLSQTKKKWTNAGPEAPPDRSGSKKKKTADHPAVQLWAGKTSTAEKNKGTYIERWGKADRRRGEGKVAPKVGHGAHAPPRKNAKQATWGEVRLNRPEPVTCDTRRKREGKAWNGGTQARTQKRGGGRARGDAIKKTYVTNKGGKHSPSKNTLIIFPTMPSSSS